VGTGRTEQGELQFGVPVEWNMEVFSLGFLSKENRRSSLWVPVEWNSEFFSVWYRSNVTRSS